MRLSGISPPLATVANEKQALRSKDTIVQSMKGSRYELQGHFSTIRYSMCGERPNSINKTKN